jgi:uncharacterized protein YoxC
MELAVAAVAIALSLVAIAFELLFYRWQTEQGARITETINNFAKEMHGVLGEIKGLTTASLGELQEQFKWLLQARVGQERVSMSEELQERVETIEQRVADVEERSEGTGDQALSAMVAELKRDVGALQGELVVLRQGAASAGKGVPRDSEAVLRLTRDFLSSGKISFPTVGDLARQVEATRAEMRLLLQDLAAGPGDAAYLMFRYGEAFKAAERAGLIETYHDAGQAGFGVRLTEAGRAFLGAGPPTKNGAAE